MAGKGLRRRDEAVAVHGLTGLQKALRRAEGDTGKLLRRELLGIAGDVRDKARGLVRTGPRPKRSNTPPLASSVRSRVTQTGASIFSDADHAIVQDVGGRVGRGRMTLLKRSDVSQYMTHAVRDSHGDIDRRLDGLLDALGRNFEKG